MNLRMRIAASLIALTIPAAMNASDRLEPLHRYCTIGVSENGSGFSVRISEQPCADRHRCNGSNFNHDPFTGLTGITIADLANDGAHLTAQYTAEAGIFTCTGEVHEAELRGEGVFTPDAAYVDKLEKLGFSGYDSDKLLAFAFIGVETAWVRSMKETGIHGLNSDNILALRIFKADPGYIHEIMAMGYAMPDAGELISLKVQGVNAEEVREIRAMGYQPTLEELVQIRIFKVTPDFIRRMKARGFEHLTIAKLVQIRIFNLAD